MKVTIKEMFKSAAEIALAKLAAKGSKLGCEITYSFGEPYSVFLEKYSPVTGETVKIERVLIDVEVSDAPVMLEGWEFLARIEFVNKDCLLHHVPGQEDALPSKYRNTTDKCDHCGHNRQRKDVFIVKKGRTFKQVGRTCLRDFLGTDSPESVINKFKFYGLLTAIGAMGDDEYNGGRHGDPIMPLQVVVEVAVLIIERLGFVPTTNDFDQPTKYVCQDYLFCSDKYGKELREKINAPVDKEYREKLNKKAADVIEWVRNLDTRGNDYLHNLKVLFVRDEVTSLKHWGLIVSAPRAYDRAMEKEETKKRKEEERKGKPSMPAPIGERVKVSGKVLKIKCNSSMYGDVWKMTVEDPRGFRVWSTIPSNINHHTLNEGDTVEFEALLKRSDRDETFAFASRPTKAKVIAEVAA